MLFSNHAVVAGTDKKGDVLITFEIVGENDTNEIVIRSKVMRKYGEHITQLIKNVLMDYDIKSAKVDAQDFGAFDFAWTARLITAIERWNQKGVNQ